MTMIRRVLSASAVAIILASTPAHLAAQESRTSAADQAAVLEWLSSVWNELADWFSSGVVTPPPAGPGGGATTQGSCAIDPFGCPDHG